MSRQYDHDGPLCESDMERFALGRIDEGRETQRRHRDADGFCVSCGRLSPCSEFQLAGEIVDRYTRFLSAEPDPPLAPNGVASRVRPYVVAGGRPPLNSGPW